MNTFASIAAALSLAAACAGADAQTVYACDSSDVWVRDMVGLVCESSNPSGHDASVGDPLGASMLTQRSAPAPALASMKAAAVCLPESQYNPEIGDKPSHFSFDQPDVATADTQNLGEAVVYFDPANYFYPARFSRVDPLDGAVPVYR